MTTRMSWCPEVGATLSDRYELERRLGHGPTGVVFAAQDRKLGEACALKVLHPTLFDGAHNATNLLRLQRARAFVHEGIARLRDVIVEGDRVFVVTALLDGLPLDAWIDRQGAPSSGEVNAILGQLVAALEWIHQIGVHGNLKPTNLLVSAGPKVTITDPWTLVGRAGIPRDQLPPADEGWLAPEQRRPGWQESRAADVHGLGLVLGLMVAARRVSGGLPLIAQGIMAPVALDTVFERATAATPADRFASVRALLEAAEPAVMAASLPLTIPGRAGRAPRAPDETTDDAWADAGLDEASVDAMLRGTAPPSGPPDAVTRRADEAADGGGAEAAPERAPAPGLSFSEPSDISFGFGSPDETIVDFGGRHGAAGASADAVSLPPLEPVQPVEPSGTGGAAEGSAPSPTGAEEAAVHVGTAAVESPRDEAADATGVPGAAAPAASRSGEHPAECDSELDLTTRLDEAGAAAVREASGAEVGEPTLMDVAATFEMPASAPPPGWGPDGASGEGAAPEPVVGAPRGAGDPIRRTGPQAEGAPAAGGGTLGDRVVAVDVLEADVLEADVLEADVLEADVLEVSPLGLGGADSASPGSPAADEGGPVSMDGTEPDAGSLASDLDVVELGASALIPEDAAGALAAGLQGVELAAGDEEDGEADAVELEDDSIVEAVELVDDSIVELGASALLEVGAGDAEIEIGSSALGETRPGAGAPLSAEAPAGQGDKRQGAEAWPRHVEDPGAPLDPAQGEAPKPPPGGGGGLGFKPGPGVGANRTGQISVADIRAGEGLPGVGGGADVLALGLEDGLSPPDSGLLGDRVDSVLSVAPIGSALDAYDSMDASVPPRPRGTSERRLGATIPPGTASALGAATAGVHSPRPGGAPRRTTTRSHELRQPVMLKRRRSPFVYVAVGLMVLAAALLVFVLTRGDEASPVAGPARATAGLDASASASAGLDAGPPGAAAVARVDVGEPSAAGPAGGEAPPDATPAPASDAAAAEPDYGGGAPGRPAAQVGAAAAGADAVASVQDIRPPTVADVAPPAPDAGAPASADAGSSVASADAGPLPAGPTAATFVPKDPKRYRCPGGMAKVRSRRKVTLADGTTVKDWDIFCIDKYEYPGQGRPPRVNVGLAEAKAACKARGRRLCSRSEWRKGCGGKYPYGRTYDPSRCNTVGEDGMPKPLVTAGFKRRCRSGWGTYDMVGNAAEWTSDGRVNGGSAYKDGASATCFRSSRRMGGHPYVGFRCCAPAIPK